MPKQRPDEGSSSVPDKTSEGDKDLTTGKGASAGEPILKEGGEEAAKEGGEEQHEPTLGEQLVTARAAHRQAQRRVKTTRQRLDRVTKKLTDVNAEVEIVLPARDSLAEWLHDRSRTFALRILSHLLEQDQVLRDDEARLEPAAREEPPLISKRVDQLRRAFLKSFWLGLVLVGVLSIGAYIGANVLVADGAHVPILGSSAWSYVALFAVLGVMAAYRALKIYHRGYSRLKGELNREVDRAHQLLESITRTRQERARIAGLYPQVAERLMLMSAVLNPPVTEVSSPVRAGLSEAPTRPAEASGASVLDQVGWLPTDLERLPGLLQVASAAIGPSTSTTRLLNECLAENVKIGGRREHLNHLLAVGAGLRGMDPHAVTLAAIDRDTSGRETLGSFAELVTDDEVRADASRALVRDVAVSIQRGLDRRTERPPVIVLNLDPLSGLALNKEPLLVSEPNTVPWDKHLCEIAENGTALSLMAFSETGRTNGEHTAFTSVVIGPSRLAGEVGRLVDFQPVDVEALTGAEVLTRIDITAPLSFDLVALFAEMAEQPQVAPATVDDEGKYFL